MVKGISRRVIVVRAPDQRFFEQAIFLLREDVLHSSAVTEEEVVRQANRAAALYARQAEEPRAAGLPGWLWFILGAMSAGAVWAVTALL